jgi:hypothetical protein
MCSLCVISLFSGSDKKGVLVNQIKIYNDTKCSITVLGQIIKPTETATIDNAETLTGTLIIITDTTEYRIVYRTYAEAEGEITRSFDTRVILFSNFRQHSTIRIE